MHARPFILGTLLVMLSGTAQAERWELTFQAYGGGVPLAHGVLHLVTNGPNQPYEAQVDTGGASWINLFTKFRYAAQSTGSFNLPAVLPERFQGERNARHKREVTTITYDGGAVTTRIDPPLSPEKAALVPDTARRGSIDPLSAGLAIIASAGSPAACTSRYPVFDGRRRYDIVTKPQAPQMLGPSSRRLGAGLAQTCVVQMHPVAGFQTDREKPNAFFAEGTERSATIWFMPMNGRTIPIQVEVPTEFGSFYVHTTQFTVTP